MSEIIHAVAAAPATAQAPGTESQQAPLFTPTTQADPADNISVAALTAKRIAAKQAALASAGKTVEETPVDPPSPEAQASSEATDTDTAPPPSEEEAQDAPEGLPSEVADALEEALAETDKAKVNAKMLRRIHSLSTKAKAAEDELDRLKAQLTPPQQQPAAQPTASSEGHPVLGPMDREITQLRTAIKNVTAHMADQPGAPMTVKGADGHEVELSPEELTRFAEEWRDKLIASQATRAATAIQVQAQEHAQMQQHRTAAVAVYPWLDKPDSAEFKLAENELKAMGPAAVALMKLPFWHSIMGRYVSGVLAEKAQKPGARVAAPMTRPKSGSVPPRVVTAPTAVPPKADGQQADIQRAEERYRKTHSIKDLTQLRQLRAAAVKA